MGDPLRTYQAQFIIEEIEKKNLLEAVADVGRYLAEKLEQISAKFPFISNVRGKGTFIAFDVDTVERRDKLLTDMKQNGINMGGSGVKSVRLRPMLVFERKHADIFLETLEKVCKSF